MKGARMGKVLGGVLQNEVMEVSRGQTVQSLAGFVG